jgi:FADH2-dependent halogenase/halogenation protein CepH
MSIDANAESFDAIVVGGGPAGSSAAARLAMDGRSVLLLERAYMPRFHIGESLIPGACAVLEQLGVLDQIRAEDFPDKHGAEFCSVIGFNTRVPFECQGAGRHPQAYNVERAAFDKILLDNARAQGATVIEGAAVESIEFEDGRAVGVTYRVDAEVCDARAGYVIDAAGRASKIAKMFGLRTKIDKLRMLAVFKHYAGFDDANHLGVAGDLQIGQHRDGWVWAIPIRSDVISVGAVMPEEIYAAGQPEALFHEHVARLKRITTRIEGAEPTGGVRVARDYSYYSDTIAGPGWLMVGDSACFLDPLFSGGVTLALTTGVRAGEVVSDLLSNPEDEAEALEHYSNFVKTGYDMYQRLIRAYYDHNYSLLPLMKSAGIDVRSGHVRDNEYLIRLMSGDFWDAGNTVNPILRAEHSMDIFSPFEHVLECPHYGVEASPDGTLARPLRVRDAR